MEEIIGIKQIELGFKLEKLGDLLQEEGPILSHFVNDRNEDFLFSWVDEDGEYHRWMLSKITNENLHLFFQQKITLRNLIQASLDNIVYFIDIDNEVNYHNIMISAVKKIPPVYLPSKKSFYKENQFEPYALKLKNYLQLHFARLQKLYPTSIPSTMSIAEPEVIYSKKGKK